MLANILIATDCSLAVWIAILKIVESEVSPALTPPLPHLPTYPLILTFSSNAYASSSESGRRGIAGVDTPPPIILPTRYSNDYILPASTQVHTATTVTEQTLY